jgi:hypothetical protein
VTLTFLSPEPVVKVCPACGIAKPLDARHFYRRVGGFQAWCAGDAIAARHTRRCRALAAGVRGIDDEQRACGVGEHGGAEGECGVSNLNELARAGAAERSFAAMPVTDAVTYGSLCSGIEAATAAWHPLGWRPAFFAEIEPFPCAVLAHHYPHVPNLGDMTKIDGADWRGKLTVLVAGTPCQAFSVAGLRKSLADRRGNLTLTFVEIVHDADPDSLFGKTSPASSARKTTLSDASSLDWWEKGNRSYVATVHGRTRVWLPDPCAPLRGGFSTLSISDWPSVGGGCSSLAAVLETGSIPARYFLSPKACRGILRRAEKRGR